MEIKERILQVAEGLFKKLGIRSVTMDDIARETGISKKTIYQFFADKDQLVETFTTLHFEGNAQKMKKIECSAQNSIEEIFLLSEHLRHELMDINPLLIFDLKRHYPKCWAIMRQHKETFVLESIKTNLKKGIEMGLYRSQTNIEVLAKMRFEQIEIGFNIDVFPSQYFNVLEVQLVFLDHFMRGILTLKGLELYETYKNIA